MQDLTLDTIGKYFLTLLITFFIVGCANKDVASYYYQQGHYKKAQKIWKKWAKIGYGEENLKLAKMASKNTIKENDKYIENQAKKAYFGGLKEAAFILEDINIKRDNYKKAFLWMQKGNLNLSKNKDFSNHLFLIANYVKSYKKQLIYLKKIEKLANQNNIFAAYNLGNFYSDKTLSFYNIYKSIKFYKIAYKNKYDGAGIKLAILYIFTLHKEKKGVDILKRIATNGNGIAAYKIGTFLYKKMQQELRKYNKPCIACNFKTPLNFYVKKLTLFRLKDLYMKQNVVPWLYRAYKLGDIDGIFQLISYDIDENNFNKNRTYSQMNLQEAINFLNSMSDKYFKAKMILAKLYEKYPNLQKVDIAKQIYIQYLDINQTDALWHLYQLNKRFYPSSNKNIFYLNRLLSKNFEPAIIEKAYYNILEKKDINYSYKILKSATDKNNTSALSYLSSIYSKGLISGVKKSRACKIACKICNIDPFNSSADMKIANCYQKIYNPQNILKAATIYKFYAENNSSDAQYKLSQIYNKNYESNKSLYWLKKAKELGNQDALFAYNEMILKGIIDGNATNTIDFFKELAQKDNPKAILILASLYGDGVVVNLDPKKAMKLYEKAMKIEKNNLLLLKIVQLYKKININHIYDNKIKNIYKKAISLGIKKAKIGYINFLIKQKKYSEAKNLLLYLPLKHYTYARYLLYNLTGNKKYLNSHAKETNNGYILLAKAKEIAPFSKRKALLYAFRAYLCNTPDNGTSMYNVMRLINNSKVIKEIYNKAKTYPRCNLQ